MSPLTSRSGARLAVTRTDDVLPGHAALITVVSAGADIIDLDPVSAYKLGRLLIDAAGDEGYREHLIALGRLSPGARSMNLAEAIEQHNDANAVVPGDADYLYSSGTPDDKGLLNAAIELIPEAWAIDIAAAAAAEKMGVSYAPARTGLRTDVIQRLTTAFAEREGDPDWASLSQGRQLDELFPKYNGIGVWELLDELGITAVYVSYA